MNNEESNSKKLSQEAQDKIKATIDWAQQREEIKNDIETNKRYDEFTDKYEKISVGVFRSMYGALKADALRWGPNILRREQDRLMKARETAAALSLIHI